MTILSFRLIQVKFNSKMGFSIIYFEPDFFLKVSFKQSQLILNRDQDQEFADMTRTPISECVKVCRHAYNYWISVSEEVKLFLAEAAVGCGLVSGLRP